MPTKFEILGGDRTKLYHATNEKLRTTSTGVSITGNLSVSADTDANAQVGRAHFGHTGSLSDVAGFSHIDHNSDTNFALIQNAAGEGVDLSDNEAMDEFQQEVIDSLEGK